MELGGWVSDELLQILGAIVIFLLWFKLFYWMRLFKPFGAFIRMITEILRDIRVFLVMLFISISAFANIIYLLNFNREENDYAPIYANLVGWGVFDSLMHSYITSLGTFETANYSEEDAVMIWIAFLFASFIVQVIFINLLIAIMSGSFTRIEAIMKQSTMKELCSIMVDHIWLQDIDKKFIKKRYLLWMSPDTSS